MEATVFHMTIDQAENDLIAMRALVAELWHTGDPRHAEYLQRASAVWVLIEEAKSAGDQAVDIPCPLIF
jgi:hypothetical protein